MRALVKNPPRRGARHIAAMILKAGAVAIFLASILAFPASGQQLGLRTLELNGFGRYTDFAPAMGLRSGVGGGLRLGYFVLPRWQLEGGVGFARVDRLGATEGMNFIPVLFDVTYNLPVRGQELLLGGGAVYNKYGPSHAWGTSVTAGVRMAFGSAAALRVDGTREYMNKRNDVARHSNWGFRLGLSWMLAERPGSRDRIAIDGGETAIVERPPTRLLRAADPVLIKQLGVVEIRDWTITTLHFDVGSAAMRPDAMATLEAKLDLLRGIPARRIRIEGQADVRGSTADNITLAWMRAGAAKLWLTNRGISADRIDVIGFGEGRPVCHDSYESCRWLNQRDEFLIVAGADVNELDSR